MFLHSPESLLYLIPAFLISLAIHEAAHAFAAHKLGDHTAQLEGRLTLNPLSHLDLFGTLALFFIGFGWGKPVPVQTAHLANPRRDMAIIAFAGPFSNFLLAFLCLSFFTFLPALQSYSPASIISFFFWHGFVPSFSLLEPAGILAIFLAVTCFLNLLLGFFNLLPIPPLDGGSVLLGILPKDFAYRIAPSMETHGIVVFFFLIGVNIFFDIPLITGPIFYLAENMLRLYLFAFSYVEGLM